MQHFVFYFRGDVLECSRLLDPQCGRAPDLRLVVSCLWLMSVSPGHPGTMGMKASLQGSGVMFRKIHDDWGPFGPHCDREQER